MPRLETVTVELALPFFKVSGTWSPDEVERQAAWEMYVELATRVTVVPLAADEGLLREALTSLYSLFGTTRSILREHGPCLARPSKDDDLNFAYLAVAVLNGALRPVLTRWHPELLAHEHRRPAHTPMLDWERRWEFGDQLRLQLEETRNALAGYADLLATVAEVMPLHVPSGGRDRRAGGETV